MSQLMFVILSAVALGGAIGVVVARSVFVSALWLTLSFMGVAGLYILLQATFLGVIQVLVYVGAISVLILFAVMLTPNMMEEPLQINRQASLGLTVALLVFTALAVIGFRTQWSVAPAMVLPAGGGQVVAAPAPVTGDEVGQVERLPYTTTTTNADGESVTTLPDPIVMLGKSFMSDQLLAFEVMSVILLVALLGAIIIARD